MKTQRKVKEEKKKAVIYARQSSGSEDVSESVEAQIMNCRKLARKEGLQIAGIYKDLNTSGETYPVGAEDVAMVDQAYQTWQAEQKDKKILRSGLGELMERIKTGDISYLIVNEMTRLYRPVNNSFLETYINNFLREKGIPVIQVQGGKIDFTQFDQHLINIIKNQILFDDLQKKRTNSIIGLNQKRDSGKLPSGCMILGIKYLGNDKLQVDRKYIPLIKFIFDEILKHRSYNAIIRDCNAKFAHLNRTFYPSNFYHIARQPIYAGYQYDTAGKLIKNVQMNGQEIISLTQWRKVQTIIGRKRKGGCGSSKRNWYPFGGRLYCSNCGGRLSVINSRGVLSYICGKTHYVGNPDCLDSRIRYSSLEKEELLGFFDSSYPLSIIGMIASYHETKKLLKISQNREKYIKEMNELEKREQFIVKLCEDKKVPEKKIENSLAALKEEKLKLSIALAETKRFSTLKFRPFQYYIKFLRKIEKIDLRERIFQDFIVSADLKATVYPDKVVYSSVAGEFSIPRMFYKNRINMPEWTIEYKEPISERGKIKIVYHAETENLVRVLKWKNLEIYVS